MRKGRSFLDTHTHAHRFTCIHKQTHTYSQWWLITAGNINWGHTEKHLQVLFLKGITQFEKLLSWFPNTMKGRFWVEKPPKAVWCGISCHSIVLKEKKIIIYPVESHILSFTHHRAHVLSLMSCKVSAFSLSYILRLVYSNCVFSNKRNTPQSTYISKHTNEHTRAKSTATFPSKLSLQPP